MEPPVETYSNERESDSDLGCHEVLDETTASGSKCTPCRAFHPPTFPRDGHEPYPGALGSQDFPIKQDSAEMVATDVMVPWVRVKADDALYLSHQIVHMNPACSILCRAPYCLTTCYCVDKLHKRFHYEVDTNYCLHVNSRCSENIDIVTGKCWPAVVMCRQCCPFPATGGYA